ncbi:MAG: outer membrane beta-barrel protein [Deltaproteobacteria bacterium]|nr:outer membrane beta-barrel protein [Deltaproteobacteria bacterium]
MMHHVRRVLVVVALSLFAVGPAAASSRADTSWYIGFGLGGGATWTRPYDTHAAVGSFQMQFEAGAILTPHWLLGGEFDISMSDAMAIGIGAGLGAALGEDEPADVAPRLFFGPMVSWYPVLELGLHLKGGLGVCTTSFFPDSDSQTGFDVRTGFGWEGRLLESFHLGLEVQHGFEVYALGWSNEVFGLVTMAWY